LKKNSNVFEHPVYANYSSSGNGYKKKLQTIFNKDQDKAENYVIGTDNYVIGTENQNQPTTISIRTQEQASNNRNSIG
jgi:hypothetical protein